MNKNFTLKCIALFAFTLIGFKAQAQYYADGKMLTRSLKVDTASPDGASPDGTLGSWYKWTLSNGATFTAGNDPDGTGTDDSNQATITWNATWPIAGGNPMDLIKDYNVIAEEFNSCQTTSTTDSKTEINVKLVKPDVLLIDAESDVCSTAKANITLYGTPGAIVNFDVTNGNVTVTSGVTNTSATLDFSGKINIEITPDGIGDVKLTVADVVFTSPASSNNPGIEFTNSTITATAGKIITIPLKQGPVISPIEF